ncbi:T9SS-dependent choice-of-anchor J family protein [Flavobacterium soli]|uniref:T9SS-dependent choice-of-anchor J family protein n=1 Tax=Flavobacterium soli TaxID=344881 RepID=UPI00146B1D0F|nr:T9SS type A sorting domain-containing protein [Flavobacterium soli]
MANAQSVVFEDSFETYDDFLITGIGDWLTIDLDGSTTYSGGGGIDWANEGAAQAFMVFNPTAAQVTNATSGTEVRNFDPKTGLKYMGAWASVTPSNNDWLVSPVLNLTGATGSSLSVWVKSMSNSYGLETYKIGVYTGTGTPTTAADFTIISGAANLVAPYPAWAERIQSLAAYDGQNIRIGILCNSNDHYMFMVDDFKVTAATLKVNNNLETSFSVSPNPATTIVNLNNDANILMNEVKVTDINGRTVKSVKLNNVSNTQVDISDLASGVYLMNVSSDQGTITKKIIKN